MTIAALFGTVVLLGLAAYVRLAPVDVARWHTALPTEMPLLEGGRCADGVIAQTNGAIASCMVAGAAGQVLTRLNDIALATPRTRLIAGSPEEGRMTWQTRSKFWGFPDFTTAQAETRGESSRLDITARLRFGDSDFGVNAARLREWLTRL